MQLALTEARKAMSRGEVPVGAVIVDYRSDQIIAISSNLCEEQHDVTAHAEMLAIKQASNILSSPRLPMCDLYVTLEPCPMCASAISFARIRRLYYGAHDIKSGGVENGARIYNASSCHYKPEIYAGIGERESSLLMKDFFKSRR